MSFARHFGHILRRGTVAAFGSALPLILPVVVVGFVVSLGGVILLLGLGLACLLAGPLAAYGLAALGAQPRPGEAFRLGVQRIWRLTPLVYLFLTLPLLLLPSAVDVFRDARTYPAAFVVMLAVTPPFLWLFARYFVLAAVCVVIETAPIVRAFRRAHELGKGRFPILLTATLFPMVLYVMTLLILAPETGAPPGLYHAALAVALLCLVVLGPALAAAAYAVVLPTTGEGAGG